MINVVVYQLIYCYIRINTFVKIHNNPNLGEKNSFEPFIVNYRETGLYIDKKIAIQVQFYQNKHKSYVTIFK